VFRDGYFPLSKKGGGGRETGHEEELKGIRET